MIWFVLILLSSPVFCHATTIRAATDIAVRVAQAEQDFEATEAPSVTLEGPEDLERPEEEPATLPDTPPAPPRQEAPVPGWWKEAQDSLNQAMDERSGEGGDTSGEPGGDAPSSDGSRSFGRNVAQGFIALCLVVALILICTYFLKRFGGRTPLLAGANLGTVLGKVYLTPKIALHFVQVKNVVLVVGVSPNGVSAVTQLSAALFEDLAQPTARANDRQLDFLSELSAATGQQSPADSEAEDDEIASLKGDLARLQKYLQETSRELGD
ncbi:MAG: hypothetical protein AMXMBFR82_30050 [Candidatus Hydrogenedentota bacterium]